MKNPYPFICLLLCCFSDAYAQSAAAVINSISFSETPVNLSEVNRYQTVYFQYTLAQQLAVKASLSKYNSNGTVVGPVSQFIINPAAATTEIPVQRSADIFIPAGTIPSAQLPNGQYYRWEASIMNSAFVYITGVTSPVTIIPRPLNTQEFSAATLSLYPNPVSELLFVKNGEQNGQLRVVDNLGRVVLTATNNGPVDVSLLKEGIYFLVTDTHQTAQFLKRQ